jgi:hypothetical protein
LLGEEKEGCLEKDFGTWSSGTSSICKFGEGASKRQAAKSLLTADTKNVAWSTVHSYNGNKHHWLPSHLKCASNT